MNPDIKDIIVQGKLKTYQFGKSFVEVYWSHPSLKENQYYLFLFTALKNDFISVKTVSPRYIPVKQKQKTFAPIVHSIMQTLL